MNVKRVIVYSRKDFINDCERLGMTTEYIDSSSYAVISIENNGEAFRHFLKDGKRVLNVELDDVDQDKDGFKTISSETSMKIFRFLEGLNKKADEEGKDLVLMVHCGAGISRSGAVGLFASEVFEIPYRTFSTFNPRIFHNRRVYTELLKACGRHYSCMEGVK